MRIQAVLATAIHPRMSIASPKEKPVTATQPPRQPRQRINVGIGEVPSSARIGAWINRLSSLSRTPGSALADLSGAFTPGGFVRRPFFGPGTSPRRFRRLASHDAALWLDFPHHRRQTIAFDLGRHLGRVLVAER